MPSFSKVLRRPRLAFNLIFPDMRFKSFTDLKKNVFRHKNTTFLVINFNINSPVLSKRVDLKCNRNSVFQVPVHRLSPISLNFSQLSLPIRETHKKEAQNFWFRQI